MRSAGIIGGLVIAAAVIGAVRCAKAEAGKCVLLDRARAEALKEKDFLRSRTIDRMPMLRLQAVRPNVPAILPDYDAGLLIKWRDGSGLLLKGFGPVVCREQELTPLQVTEHEILLAGFTKKRSKATRQRTRMPRREARRSRAKPPVMTPAVLGRAME